MRESVKSYESLKRGARSMIPGNKCINYFIDASHLYLTVCQQFLCNFLQKYCAILYQQTVSACGTSWQLTWNRIRQIDPEPDPTRPDPDELKSIVQW